MGIINSLFLGIVQGLTEFLPISSSGHLVIFQKILPGFSQPGVLFDVILHFGTLLAVIVYFRRNLVKLIINNFWFLVIGTIPAFLVGILFDNTIEKLFSNVVFVGFAFFVNAAMSYSISAFKSKNVQIGYKNSFLIGIAQSISIAPGISRSGSTIFSGTLLGIDKEKAAEFSFILSLPAVFGANLLEIYKFISGEQLSYTLNYNEYLMGAISAFVFGLLAIKIVMNFIYKGRFRIFAIYSLVAGLVVLFLNL